MQQAELLAPSATGTDASPPSSILVTLSAPAFGLGEDTAYGLLSFANDSAAFPCALFVPEAPDAADGSAAFC